VIGRSVGREYLMAERPASQATRLGLTAKVLYGVGEVSNAGKGALFGLYLLFFYTSVMGLPGTLAGAAAAIGLAWDATIDPLIGRLSDRARLPLGRRHPFMLLGALLSCVAFYEVFSPPQGLSTPLLFAWFVGWNLLVRLAGSLFAVPYLALGAELSQDYRERTTITGIRGACGLLGTMALTAQSFVLFFPNAVPGEDPKLRYDGYPSMGFVFGLVMSTAALVATVGTLPWRSRRNRLDDRDRAAPTIGFLRGLAMAMQCRPFRALVLSSSLVFLAGVVSTNLAIHFLTYYVRIADSRALGSAQVAFYVGALVGVLLWTTIARRLEKRQVYLMGTFAMAAPFIAATLLLGDGRPLGTGDVRPVLVIYALGGLFGSVFSIIPASMVADVVDDDEATIGQRREGVFFGIFSFSQQAAAGLSILTTGIMIDWFAGLVPGQAEQSALTTDRIGLLFGLLPAGLLIVAALLIWNYPLDARRVAAIQLALAHRRSP